MNEILKDIYLPLLGTFLCGALILVVTKYMSRGNFKKIPSEFRVLRYYAPNKPSRTLIISLIIVLAVNLFSGLLAVILDKVSSAEILYGRTLRAVTLNAVVFGYFYYLGFGSLSFVIYHNVGEHNSLPLCLAQGNNTAIIAGALVYPLQSIGYVVSCVLSTAEPSNLYALEWHTMLALYFYAFVTSLGYGLLVSSIFTNVNRSNAPIVIVHRNQNRIIFIVIAIAVFGPAFSMWVNPGSLFAKSLMFNNVFLVWCTFLLVSAGSYVLGSWIFTLLLNQLLFTNIKENKPKHPRKRKEDNVESQEK